MKQNKWFNLGIDCNGPKVKTLELILQFKNIEALFFLQRLKKLLQDSEVSYNNVHCVRLKFEVECRCFIVLKENSRQFS